jgi:hypothetical protein
MIMSSCKRNRNVPFGRIAAGGQDGRETTDGTERIAERKSHGTRETGAVDDTGGGEGTQSELPTRTADICRLSGGGDISIGLRHPARNVLTKSNPGNNIPTDDKRFLLDGETGFIM